VARAASRIQAALTSSPMPMKPTDCSASTDPSRDPWLQFIKRTQEALELGKMAVADFKQAKDDLARKECGYARRNVVRCFGSLVDVLAAILRDVSFEMGEGLGKPRNHFLRDKSGGRGTTASFRVKASYRLVAELVPQSVFARIDPVRWEQLHHAFEVRNRVLHPNSMAGMKVSDMELRLILATAAEFLNDLEEFFRLCQLHSQNLYQLTNDQRVRVIAKIRLKDTGHCSSRREFEHCSTAPLAA
jgi:hypothetical protein